MKILWNQNPLISDIEVDETDIEKMEDTLWNENISHRVYAVLRDKFDAPNDTALEKSLENLKIAYNMIPDVLYYVSELKSLHIGDCTCVPASCGKCYAESLLGVSTISLFGKHELYKIQEGFSRYKTIDEVIDYLKNHYNPQKSSGWAKYSDEVYNSYKIKWIAEAKTAAAKLELYKERHKHELICG